MRAGRELLQEPEFVRPAPDEGVAAVPDLVQHRAPVGGRNHLEQVHHDARHHHPIGILPEAREEERPSRTVAHRRPVDLITVVLVGGIDAATDGRTEELELFQKALVELHHTILLVSAAKMDGLC
jgi:hypothetical protein